MNALEIPDINLNKELSKCKNMEDFIGKNGLMQRLFGGIIQQFLEAEMEEHLGREKYERQDDSAKNYRNGYSTKNIKSSFGEVGVDIPRDRSAEFEPKIVKKYETVCNELDKKIIGLYARGMSVDDIKSDIDELYGVDLSPAMVSKITDKVMDTATAWQNRSLDPLYPIVYLDAILSHAFYKTASMNTNEYVLSSGLFCHSVTTGIILLVIFDTISADISTSYRFFTCSTISLVVIPAA